MYSYGPLHMAEQKQDDQLEHNYSSYVRIRDVALKTCQRWWTIGRSGERGPEIAVLSARHDDDDDYVKILSCPTFDNSKCIYLAVVSVFDDVDYILNCSYNFFLLWMLFLKVWFSLVWFGLVCWVLWHINLCRLFNAKSSSYLYIKYIWFGLVGFYGISTIVGYLMPNPLYTYILNIYDLVWLVFMAYQPLSVI